MACRIIARRGTWAMPSPREWACCEQLGATSSRDSAESYFFAKPAHATARHAAPTAARAASRATNDRTNSTMLTTRSTELLVFTFCCTTILSLLRFMLSLQRSKFAQHLSRRPPTSAPMR